MKLIVTALFLFSFEAAAVTFKGVIDKDQKIILGLYPTLALNKPDYSIIDLAVAELSQTKNYNTVKATYTNGSVSITATPSKKIKLIEFIGNKAFTDSQLVKISKLKTNSSFSKEEFTDSIFATEDETFPKMSANNNSVIYLFGLRCKSSKS